MGQLLTNEEFMTRLDPSWSDYIEILSEYTNYRTPMVCKCKKCGHIFERHPKVLCETVQCPKCRERNIRRVDSDEAVERLAKIRPDLKIVGDFINMTTDTDFQCSHNHIWTAKPAPVIIGGHGCPYCSRHKPWIGETDLWTTRPDVAKLLKNPEDGYKYMDGSSSKADFICPDCGAVNNKCIYMVCERGLFCNKCADGVSYPNKFGRAFLEQLPIENWICEYQPRWTGQYLYDNYFEYNDERYILEMDGALHYEGGVLRGKSLEERQAVDKIKTDDAIKNGVNIVRIDCNISDAEYISQNILKSELSQIFDLQNIDWDICDRKAQSNNVLIACNMYRNGEYSIQKIARALRVSDFTARGYLRQGGKLGLCDYNSKLSLERFIVRDRTDFVLLDNDGRIARQFNGVANNLEEISKMCGVTMNCTGIHRSCQKHRPYKGFNFRYLSEYTTE